MITTTCTSDSSGIEGTSSGKSRHSPVSLDGNLAKSISIPQGYVLNISLPHPRSLNSLPSPYKRLVAAFSVKGDVVVPEIPGTRIDISAAIISPERITDERAEILNLYNPGNFANDPEGLKAQKSSPRNHAIIKEFFRAMTQFEKGNNRMLLCERMSRGALLGLTPPYSPPRYLAGALVFFSKTASTGKDPGKTMQVIPNAYDALRKTEHVISSYKSELDTLQNLATTLNEFANRTEKLWRKDSSPELKEQLLNEWRGIYLKCEEALKLSRDASKVKASEKISAISELRDKEERLNPHGSAKKMKAAVDRLLERKQRGWNSISYIENDNLLLRERITSQETLVINFCNILKTQGKRSFAKCAIFNGSKLSPKERQANVTGFMKSFGADISRLSSVRMRPLRTAAHLLTRRFKDLENAASAGNLDKAQKTWEGIQNVCCQAEKIIRLERQKNNLPQIH